MIFQTKKQMEEMKDKLSADSKSRLESEIKKVEDALSSNDTDRIKSAYDDLTKVWNEIASQLYQQAGADRPGATEHRDKVKRVVRRKLNPVRMMRRMHLTKLWMKKKIKTKTKNK